MGSMEWGAGPSLCPRHGDPASHFPEELFLEALALLTRKPEAALAPVPASATRHRDGGSRPVRGLPQPTLDPHKYLEEPLDLQAPSPL